MDSFICLHRNRKLNLDANQFAQLPFAGVAENLEPAMMVRVGS